MSSSLPSTRYVDYIVFPMSSIPITNIQGTPNGLTSDILECTLKTNIHIDTILLRYWKQQAEIHIKSANEERDYLTSSQNVSFISVSGSTTFDTMLKAGHIGSNIFLDFRQNTNNPLVSIQY